MSETPPKRVEGIVLDKDGTPLNMTATNTKPFGSTQDSKEQIFGKFSSHTRRWSSNTISPWLVFFGAALALPLVLIFLVFIVLFFVTSAVLSLLLGRRPPMKFYKWKS